MAGDAPAPPPAAPAVRLAGGVALVFPARAGVLELASATYDFPPAGTTGDDIEVEFSTVDSSLGFVSIDLLVWCEPNALAIQHAGGPGTHSFGGPAAADRVYLNEERIGVPLFGAPELAPIVADRERFVLRFTNYSPYTQRLSVSLVGQVLRRQDADRLRALQFDWLTEPPAGQGAGA